MAGPGDLHALSLEVLDAAAAALDTIPIYEPHLNGAQARQFVSPNTPVWDCCDQLAVWPTPLTEADTSPGGLNAGHRFHLGRINHVLFSIEITRCIPTDLEPAPAALTASAEQLNADAWALWNYFFNYAESGGLITLCQEVFFEGITAVSPSGGCGGWTANIRVQLDGYGYGELPTS